MIYRIGLTGGIGAGKSTVASVFQVLGIPVYHSDQRARDLMTRDHLLRRQLIDLLGNEAFNGENLNKSFIANRIFSDPWTLERLNSLVHPVVERDYIEWHKNQISIPYTVNEAALLFDNGRFLTLDAVIHVAAPEEIRILRVMKRDGIDRAGIISRMKNQWPENRRCQMADYLVENKGELLLPQIIEIHRKLKGLPG